MLHFKKYRQAWLWPEELKNVKLHLKRLSNRTRKLEIQDKTQESTQDHLFWCHPFLSRLEKQQLFPLLNKKALGTQGSYPSTSKYCVTVQEHVSAIAPHQCFSHVLHIHFGSAWKMSLGHSCSHRQPRRKTWGACQHHRLLFTQGEIIFPPMHHIKRVLVGANSTIHDANSTILFKMGGEEWPSVLSDLCAQFASLV